MRACPPALRDKDHKLSGGGLAETGLQIIFRMDDSGPYRIHLDYSVPAQIDRCFG